MDFGIGVGWNKEEVEACGYRWEDRGARCDEFMITFIGTSPSISARVRPYPAPDAGYPD